MAHFYLIRHLPTLWNLKGILQGRSDTSIADINADDRVEIVKNRKQLKSINARIFSSPRLRARQTAVAYQLGEAEESSLLDELNFGSYEGKPKSELVKFKNGLWKNFPTRVELGESWEEFEERIQSFLYRFDTSDKVIVFGHGAWIRAAVALCLFKDINRMNMLEIRNNQIKEIIC